MNNSFILIIAIGLSNLLVAQKNEVDGFVVTNTNDTIRGQVVFRNYIDLYQEPVKIDIDGTKKKYYANQIKSFSLKSTSYVSMLDCSPKRNRFMKELVCGDIHLFVYSHAVSVDNPGLIHKYYVIKSGECFKINMLKYKKELSKICSDKKKVLEAINDMQLYGEKDLIDIINIYNYGTKMPLGVDCY